jgi:prevent-host-death family protein
VTQFRANASAILAQFRTTKRPIVLTQQGRGAAVLTDVVVCQHLFDQLAQLGRVEFAPESAPEAAPEFPRTQSVADARKRIREGRLED